MASDKHCYDYIDDTSQPDCLRKFIDHATSPAHGALRDEPRPKLFADHNGSRVQVVMASRLGDVGITPDLSVDYGYQKRVFISDLSNFSDLPTPPSNDAKGI